MFCKQCGASIADGSRFCRKCGAAQGGPVIKQAPPVQQPVYQTPPQPARYSAGSTGKTGADTSGKKSGKGGGLCVFLAVVLAAEFLVAGFLRPGWFIKGGEPEHVVVTPPEVVPPGDEPPDIVPPGDEPPGGESDPGIDYSRPSGDPVIAMRKDPDTVPQEVATEAVLTPDQPVAVFDNGVIIDMTDAVNFEQSVACTDSGVVAGDDGRESKTYNITMGDGGYTVVPELMAVTLPCEPSWDASHCMVEYHDLETDSWIPVYTEQNVKDNTVTFYPDHFTEYKVTWWDMIKTYFGSQDVRENWPLFYYEMDDPTPTSKVTLNEELLQYRLRSKPSQAVKTAQSIPSPDYFKIGCDFIGNTSDAVGGTVSFGELATGVPQELSDFSSGLGEFGNAVAFLQLFYDTMNEGSLFEAFKGSWQGFAKMAFDYAAQDCLSKATAATVSNAANVLWLMYLAGDKLYETAGNAIRLGGTTEMEYAYIFYTVNYVGVDVKNAKAKGFNKEDAALRDFDMATQGYMRMSPPSLKKDTDAWDLSSLGYVVQLFYASKTLSSQAMWADALKEIAENSGSFDDEKKLERMNKAIDAYCNAFWELSKTERDEFLSKHTVSTGGSTFKDVWNEPDDKEKEKMIANLKGQIYGANKSIFEPMIQKSFTSIMNAALESAAKRRDYLNEEITFTLKDSAVSNFKDSVYTQALDLKIPQKAFKKGFDFTKENGWQVKCTRYAWMLAGCPQKLEYNLDGVAEYATFNMTPGVKETVIELDSNRDRVDLHISAPMKVAEVRFGLIYEEEVPSASLSVTGDEITVDIPGFHSSHSETQTSSDGSTYTYWRKTQQNAFSGKGRVRNSPHQEKDYDGNVCTAYTFELDTRAPIEVTVSSSSGSTYNYRIIPSYVRGELYLFEDGHKQADIGIYGSRTKQIDNEEPKDDIPWGGEVEDTYYIRIGDGGKYRSIDNTIVVNGSGTNPFIE